MTPREQEEYRALRATIRERGTTRVWIFVLGVGIWAGTVTATAALGLPPVATFVSLVVLAATFEGVLALHVSVERIGRYLRVFHNDRWEIAAAAFGQPRGAVALDALFAALFFAAAIANLFPLFTSSPVAIEIIVVGLGHAAFVARIVMARALTLKQRAVDAARFEEIRQKG